MIKAGAQTVSSLQTVVRIHVVCKPCYLKCVTWIIISKSYSVAYNNTMKAKGKRNYLCEWWMVDGEWWMYVKWKWEHFYKSVCSNDVTCNSTRIECLSRSYFDFLFPLFKVLARHWNHLNESKKYSDFCCCEKTFDMNHFQLFDTEIMSKRPSNMNLKRLRSGKNQPDSDIE